MHLTATYHKPFRKTVQGAPGMPRAHGVGANPIPFLGSMPPNNPVAFKMLRFKFVHESQPMQRKG